MEKQLKLKPLEGKNRCFYCSCSKNFSSLSFLVKHIINKHEGFADESLAKVSYSYMEKRFSGKNVVTRQLPPVIESTVSGELQPVLIKFAMIPYVVPPPPPAPPPRPPFDPIILGAAPTLTDMITDADAPNPNPPPPPPPPAQKKFVHIDTPKVI